MSGSTYKINDTFGKRVKVMHTTVGFLDTETGANLIHLALILLEWGNSIKKELYPRLRTATK